MKNYYRATITIPTDTYRNVKIKAALRNKSVSKFISELLAGTADKGYIKDAPLPFGKYSVKGEKKISRESMYESYLRHKVSR